MAPPKFSVVVKKRTTESSEPQVVRSEVVAAENPRPPSGNPWKTPANPSKPTENPWNIGENLQQKPRKPRKESVRFSDSCAATPVSGSSEIPVAPVRRPVSPPPERRLSDSGLSKEFAQQPKPKETGSKKNNRRKSKAVFSLDEFIAMNDQIQLTKKPQSSKNGASDVQPWSKLVVSQSKKTNTLIFSAFASGFGEKQLNEVMSGLEVGSGEYQIKKTEDNALLAIFEDWKTGNHSFFLTLT